MEQRANCAINKQKCVMVVLSFLQIFSLSSKPSALPLLAEEQEFLHRPDNEIIDIYIPQELSKIHFATQSELDLIGSLKVDVDGEPFEIFKDVNTYIRALYALMGYRKAVEELFGRPEDELRVIASRNIDDLEEKITDYEQELEALDRPSARKAQLLTDLWMSLGEKLANEECLEQLAPHGVY